MQEFRWYCHWKDRLVFDAKTDETLNTTKNVLKSRLFYITMKIVQFQRCLQSLFLYVKGGFNVFYL